MAVFENNTGNDGITEIPSSKLADGNDKQVIADMEQKELQGKAQVLSAIVKDAVSKKNPDIFFEQPDNLKIFLSKNLNTKTNSGKYLINDVTIKGIKTLLLTHLNKKDPNHPLLFSGATADNIKVASPFAGYLQFGNKENQVTIWANGDIADIKGIN